MTSFLKNWPLLFQGEHGMGLPGPKGQLGPLGLKVSPVHHSHTGGYCPLALSVISAG